MKKRQGIVVISHVISALTRCISSRLPLFVDGMLFALLSSVDHGSFVAQRVTGKEIEITVGVHVLVSVL